MKAIEPINIKYLFISFKKSQSAPCPHSESPGCPTPTVGSFEWARSWVRQFHVYSGGHEYQTQGFRHIPPPSWSNFTLGKFVWLSDLATVTCIYEPLAPISSINKYTVDILLNNIVLKLIFFCKFLTKIGKYRFLEFGSVFKLRHLA